MSSLSVFNFITLNGFYKGLNEDISWHMHGVEEGEYSAQSLEADNILLFGRVTYEMMYSFWPTEVAMQQMPDTAKGMNKAEKIVFSKTMKQADWANTTVINDDIVNAVKKRKEGSKNMTILGSGSIVSQLADAGLIDAYEIMIDPVAIGRGTPIFNDIKQSLQLELVNTRVFKSGCILCSYKPI